MVVDNGQKCTLAEQLMAVWPMVAMLQAEESHDSRIVGKRCLVWADRDAIFRIKIPCEGKAVRVVDLSCSGYLLLARPVLGGAVNLYVHHAAPASLFWGHVYAHMEIWRREYCAGQRGESVAGGASLHLHFLVVPGAPQATHRWRVFQNAPEDGADIRGMRSPIIFKTPPPLFGAIGICAIKKAPE